MHSLLERKCLRVLFFIVFEESQISKTCFTEKKIIRYYYFVNIYIIYQNKAFILIKVAFFNCNTMKLYIFCIIFIYGFNKFLHTFFNYSFLYYFHLNKFFKINFCLNQISEVYLQLKNFCNIFFESLFFKMIIVSIIFTW